MPAKIILVIVVCLWQVCSCFAQLALTPEHVDVSATRSGNNVLTFFEDSRGFIWCGTMEDMVRYDGFSVKKYSYTQSAGEIRIVSIAEDEEGNIWFCSEKFGLMQLPLGRQGFGPIVLPVFKKMPKAAKITFDNKGNLWGISQNRELFTLNIKDSSVYVWPLEKTGALEFLGFSASGSLWIAGAKGAFCINDFSKNNLQQVLETNIRVAVIEANTAYFHARNQVYKAEENNKKISVTILTDIADTSANKGSRHIIATTTNSLTPFLITAILNQPIQMIDKVNGTSVSYAFAGGNTLKYEVHSCYFSHTGKLYIGTNQGFFRLGLGSKAFKAYTDAEAKLRCVISVSNDTLLFGTQGRGMLRYVRNGNGVWKKDENKQVVNAKNIISQHTINRFYRDRKGRLWAATNGGLCYENGDTWQFVFERVSVWGITQDDSGVFWLGTYGEGLLKFDPVSGKRESFYLSGKYLGDGVKNSEKIWSTHSHKGKIYLGTVSGLQVFDPETKTFSEAFSGKFRDVSVWDFFISDTLWIIPTQGKGLWQYKPKSDRMEQVKTVQNYYYGLQYGGHNSVWVISDKGALAYTQPSENPISFSAGDGLSTDYFSFTGIADVGKDAIVLCGENGFTVADIREALKENNNPNNRAVFISSLKYSGIPMADFLPTGSVIELDYDKGQLLLEWAASHFQQHKHQLYYKLDGVDENWNISGVDNKINYVNLSPGAYTFTAYIAGQQQAYRLVIKIIPPFWLTLWFRILLAVIAVALLVYIFYSWAARQKLKHAQLKSEIDALRAQINPHFVFNVLNSIQVYIYKEDRVEANEYLAKFANLMRKILENSREEIITLHREQVFLSLYLEMEALRFKGRLKYEVLLSAGCRPEALKIPSMLVQPLVENALKYGAAENRELQVTVQFSCQNGMLVCEVRDNGEGFVPREEIAGNKTSLGLKLVSERLFTLSKIYGKEYRMITGNNTTGTGAFVRLTIPQHD